MRTQQTAAVSGCCLCARVKYCILNMLAELQSQQHETPEIFSHAWKCGTRIEREGDEKNGKHTRFNCDVIHRAAQHE